MESWSAECDTLQSGDTGGKNVEVCELLSIFWHVPEIHFYFCQPETFLENKYCCCGKGGGQQYGSGCCSVTVPRANRCTQRAAICCRFQCATTQNYTFIDPNQRLYPRECSVLICFLVDGIFSGKLRRDCDLFSSLTFYASIDLERERGGKNGIWSVCSIEFEVLLHWPSHGELYQWR